MNTVVNVASICANSANYGLFKVGNYLKSFIYPKTIVRKEKMLGKKTGDELETNQFGFTSESISDILSGYKKMQMRYKANSMILKLEEQSLEQLKELSIELNDLIKNGSDINDDYVLDWIQALEDRQTQIESNCLLLKQNQELYEQYKHEFPNKTKTESMSDDDFWQCKICEENRKNRALGCGHVFCDKCTSRLTLCPNCKLRIDTSKIINVFL